MNIIIIMGCMSSADNRLSIPIENNIVALIVSGQTKPAVSKLKQLNQQFDINTSINFRGDTILHYACAKDNEELVRYLVSRPDLLKSTRNKQDKLAKQLTKNERIIEMCS